MSEALLKVRDLYQRFGGITAVDGISMEIEKGGFRCIIGPNGAGKSTLFNMLCGTLKPLAGSILFEGRNIVGLPLHTFARIGITRKFQIPSVFEIMTVRDNLVVSGSGGDKKRGSLTRVDKVLEMLNLTMLAEAHGGELAHGQKQWLEIGMALMCEPKLLLLDEPTAGMTAEETQKTAELLLGLRGDLTMITIEHDMRFVRALNSNTMVMHQGRVIAEGSFSDIEQNETVRDVYLGRQ